jgi:hypothetical protein
MHNDLTWNDPYSYLLKLFLTKNPDLKYSFFFTRSNCKKTIMTIPYSIGENSAWKYFIENIDKDAYDKKILRKEFKLFFNFVKNYLDGDKFFKNSTDRIILYAITQAHWLKDFHVTIKNGKAHLIYYKSKKKVIDLTIKVRKNTIRITKTINTIDKSTPDLESMTLSIRANWMAILDAECLRDINSTFDHPFFSIHDSVLPDWLSQDRLVMVCNEILSINTFSQITWDNSHPYLIFSYVIIL